jgi:carbonic anhydrase
MINKIVELAEESSMERRKDPAMISQKKIAKQGQSPRFLMISPIDRSSQDLQLFGIARGDAFHGTRGPRMPLLPAERSQFLLGGPAAYNREFPNEHGVILTFEQDEPETIVKESLDSLVVHPDIKGIPIIAFRVDYEQGRARIIPHGKGRNYEAEIRLLARLHRPDVVDENTLVLICSDSRIHPPITPEGLPMAIQTLGGYIPKYSKLDDETFQLNDFFTEWLSTKSKSRHILIVVHGNFEGEGPSCGAALASLNPANVKNPLLNSVISELQMAAAHFEDYPPKNAEERVESLSLAIKENLLSYPSVKKFADANPDDFINILLMDTVSNVLSPTAI